MNRSKRYVSSLTFTHLLKQTRLIISPVFTFLVPDVLTDRCLIGPHRRNKISPCPKRITGEIFLPPQTLPRDHDGTFPFDVPDHHSDRMFRRDAHQHVDVVRTTMSFEDFRLPLRGKPMENLTKFRTQVRIQYFASTLRYKNQMVLAVPLGIA